MRGPGSMHTFRSPFAGHGPLLVGCAAGTPSPVLDMEELPDNPECTLLTAPDHTVQPD